MIIDLRKIQDSRVMVRVGFDIPSLHDIERVQAAKETINLLRQNNNTLILLTKWGKPKGKHDPALSTQALLPVLKRELQCNIVYINQFNYPHATQLADAVAGIDTDIVLFENIYFDARENSKDDSQRLEIAQWYAHSADVFVDECFISSHRVDATNTELSQLLPSCKGCHYEREISQLNTLKHTIHRPYVVIMGGAKLETKLPVIHSMVSQADSILVGGKLAYTFLAAVDRFSIPYYTPVNIHQSEVEEGFIEQARDLLEMYHHIIHLPVDTRVYTDSSGNSFCFDIGDDTITQYINTIHTAHTVFWNGPLGFVEKEGFERGTQAIAHAISVNDSCYSVAGGGDTVACLDKTIKESFSYISQGGGASLYYLTS